MAARRQTVSPLATSFHIWRYLSTSQNAALSSSVLLFDTRNALKSNGGQKLVRPENMDVVTDVELKRRWGYEAG